MVVGDTEWVDQSPCRQGRCRSPALPPFPEQMMDLMLIGSEHMEGSLWRQ